MTIPLVPAMPYGSPIISLPSRIFRQPPEGNRSVPLDIQWSIPLALATPLNAVSFNLAVAAPQTLSQIVAVTVDNSRSGSDVTLVFPDTDTTLDIPAYEQVTSQVFTGGLSFYAVASNPSTSDETALTVHNFLPPPISIPISENQTFAGAQTIGDIVLAGTVNGFLFDGPCTLRACCIYASATAAAGSYASVSITNGLGGNVLLFASIAASTSGNLVNLSSLFMRAPQGLAVSVHTITAFTGTSFFGWNCMVSTP